MTHKPKTAALEALAADLLSEAGAERIERHLKDCEICRQELAAIHVYREAQQTVASTTPEVDWRKMELALAREARAQAAQRRAPSRWLTSRGALGGVALAVAAAALLVWSRGASFWGGSFGGGSRGDGSHEVIAHRSVPHVTATRGPEAAEPERTFAAGVVSMLAGSASFASEGIEDTALSVGRRIENGTLATAALSQAHLVLHRPATGPAGAVGAAPSLAVARLAVGPDSRLQLGEASTLAVDGPSLQLSARLERGRTTIDAFEADARVVVLAGTYRVEIRAARCTIDLADDGEGHTRVSVAAADPEVGEVIVIDAEGHRHDLTGADAPRAWSSSGEPAQLAELAQAPGEGALLELSHDGAVRFEIDDRSIEGGPTLAMRVAPGLVSVRAFDATGRMFRTEVSVGPDGLALAPDALQPLRPRIQGYLAPEEITPVVRQSQRALQRCYEQALRLRPDLGGGLLRARVTLDAHGAVRRVQLEHDGAPALEACVRQEAASWAFPPPGGPMSFELPLRFHASSP